MRVLLDIFWGFLGFFLAVVIVLPICVTGCNGDCVTHCGTWWGLPLPEKWLGPIVLIGGVVGAATGLLVHRWLMR